MLVTVEVIREGALDLLSDMERLDLIRLNTPTKNNAIYEKNISRQFAGALHLSDADYNIYQNVLKEGRKEWHKDIC